MKRTGIVLSAVLAAGVVGPRGTAAQHALDDRPTPIRSLTAGSLRNPAFLRAAALLTRRDPGHSPRVRFEWEQVPGAAAYLLSGAWTDPRAWTVQVKEVRVTPQLATRWANGAVALDLSLPAGSHSWRVVALFGPGDLGDFSRPKQVTFDLE
jgi:hypothetical protein